MSDGIKDYILPEFITDKEVCKREFQIVQDNIEYLEKLRLQYLKKYAELTNQKVFREFMIVIMLQKIKQMLM